MADRPDTDVGLYAACLYDVAKAALDPRPPRTDLSRVPAGRSDSGLSMSNVDGSIDVGLEEALRGGALGAHTGWDHFGKLWYDGGLFYEEVWRYRVPQEVFSAPTLPELMRVVNEKWGWE